MLIPNHCLLVDAMNLMHRFAHTPVAQLRASSNESTGITYGVLKALRASLDKDPAQRAVFVIDGFGLSPRRMGLLPTYKAERRAKKPDRDYQEDFHECRERLEKLLPTLGVIVVKLDREADDVIAALAAEPELSGQRVTVLSEDKDLCQLVYAYEDRVEIERPIAQQRVGAKNFEELLGTPAHLYLLARAILGDPSDEIPGVRGTGEKSVAAICAGIRDLVGEMDSYGEEQLLAFCRTHPSRKISQVASAPNMEIVRRNLEMMDLSLEMLSPREFQRVRELLEDSPGLRVEAVRAHLDACELSSITVDLEQWCRPFAQLQQAEDDLGPLEEIDDEEVA